MKKVHTSTGIQVYRYFGIQVIQVYTVIQVYRYTVIYSYTGIQLYRYTVIYSYTGIQVMMSIETQTIN